MLDPLSAVVAEHRRRRLMAFQHHVRNGHGESRRYGLCVSDVAQDIRLFETPHADRPFDDLTAATEFQVAIVAAGDRRKSNINLRCMPLVDLNLTGSGNLALLES